MTKPIPRKCPAARNRYTGDVFVIAPHFGWAPERLIGRSLVEVWIPGWGYASVSHARDWIPITQAARDVLAVVTR